MNKELGTQKDWNPFLYSDSNKRYHTYDYYLRHTFGEKCAKIPLDAGMTCPNRDGRCGTGGCIYCSDRGSGDFAASARLPIAEQYRLQREVLLGKWPRFSCIPYFQPHTNTYAPVERLRALYEEALSLPDAVALNIATRADCLPDETVALLDELSQKNTVTVELGLQTVHDKTGERIGRGHSFEDFLSGYRRLRRMAPRVRVGMHVIFGLIGENDEMMVETAQIVAGLRPDELKIHSLYVIEGTEMAEIYRNGGYSPISMNAYVELVVRALELMPPETVIGRLTGDGPQNTLLAPLWTRNKRNVLNEIDKKFYNDNSWQGKRNYQYSGG